VTYTKNGPPKVDASATVYSSAKGNLASSHWGFLRDSLTFELATAGNAAQPGSPTHMVVAPLSTPNASLLMPPGSHQPSFNQAAVFFLADAGIHVAWPPRTSPM
jgi:hypothetical protein